MRTAVALAHSIDESRKGPGWKVAEGGLKVAACPPVKAAGKHTALWKAEEGYGGPWMAV